MVTDQQVRRMRMLVETGQTLAMAAAKAGMHRETARRYRELGKLPSDVAVPHMWRTRGDPFEGVWAWCRQQLELSPGLQAKTLFDALQRQYPGRFQDGQLRTLQRRVKVWRATEGPGKEVFFARVHHPGVLGQSDFTDMTGLGITIQGRRFEHLVYHFVLTYSNWESWTVCFSESFESLSEGLQQVLWELGAVPAAHQTDRLSAAVNNLANVDGVSVPKAKKAFTRRYQALLNHYGLTGRKIQAGKANENGDVEQRHHRLKEAVDQALMLRGSRDFESREAYEAFLRDLTDRLNAGRRERLAEELVVMKPLPDRRLEACKELRGLRVDRGSLMVQELLAAKRDLKLSRRIKRLAGYPALILDDLGYVQQSREEMEVLFTLLAERYERGSVMITSNLPFSKWETIFKDPMTTAAAIDRLVHHSVILELNVPSYRLEQAKKRKPAVAKPGDGRPPEGRETRPGAGKARGHEAKRRK